MALHVGLRGRHLHVRSLSASLAHRLEMASLGLDRVVRWDTESRRGGDPRLWCGGLFVSEEHVFAPCPGAEGWVMGTVLDLEREDCSVCGFRCQAHR